MLPTITKPKTADSSHSTRGKKDLFLKKLPSSSSNVGDDRMESGRSDHHHAEQEGMTWKSHRNTSWGQCVETVTSRPKGWIKRFADGLDESNIYEPKTRDEIREENLKKSGWTNIIVEVDSIEMPTNSRKKDTYQKFPKSELRSKLCTYCFRTVHFGADFVGCERCDLVSHVNCIPDIEKYSQKKRSKKLQPTLIEVDKRHSLMRQPTAAYAGLDLTNRPNTAPSLSALSNDPFTQSREYETTVIAIQDEYTAKDLRWLCEFCQKDMIINKLYFEMKHREQIFNYNRFIACLRLQSFFRMGVQVLKYRRFRRGVIIFQQMIRMRKFAKMAEQERINQRYMFKIRIHDLKIFTLDTYYQNLINENPSHTARSMSAESCDEDRHYISTGHNSQHNDRNLISSMHNQMINLTNSNIIPFPVHRYPFLVGKLSSTRFEKCLMQYLSKQNNLAINANTNSSNHNSVGESRESGSHHTKSGPSTPGMMTPLHGSSDELDDHSLNPENHDTNHNSSNAHNSNQQAEEEKEKEVLDLIFANHAIMENPQYAKPYRDMQILMKGTLFLTVTVLEHQTDELTSNMNHTNNPNNQVFVNMTTSHAQINLLESTLHDPLMQGNTLQTYRYDLLLKHTGQSTKAKLNLLQKLGFGKNQNHSAGGPPSLVPAGINPSTGLPYQNTGHNSHTSYGWHSHQSKSTDLDHATLEKLSRLYNLDTYTASKPFILIPYTHANITIKFTLSEVTDWPKAAIIGQSVFKPQHFIIRKKILSVHQSISMNVKLDEMPATEEGGKIVLQMPKGYNYSHFNAQQQQHKSDEALYSKQREDPNRFLPKEKDKIVKDVKKLLTGANQKRKSMTEMNPFVNIQALYPMITWTLMAAYKYDGQDYGFIHIVNPVSQINIHLYFYCYF
jgi:hypothetical protein